MSKKPKEYAISPFTTGRQIREVRKSVGMTQKEFAAFAGVSTPTVERWEGSDGKITGPIVTLLALITRDPDLPEKMTIPANKLKQRLYYMHDDMICTVIDVDDLAGRVEIHNYTANLLLRAFGKNTAPTYEDYEEFLESRCFPRTRDKIKLELARLDIPFYDPRLIIEKTQGRMNDDHFWIRMDGVLK